MKTTTNQEIVEKLGLGVLPEDVQKEALERVNQVVELRMAGTLDDLMGKEQRATLNTLSEKSPDSVRVWLNEQFGDMNELYESFLQDYLTELETQKQ